MHMSSAPSTAMQKAGVRKQGGGGKKHFYHLMKNSFPFLDETSWATVQLRAPSFFSDVPSRQIKSASINNISLAPLNPLCGHDHYGVVMEHCLYRLTAPLCQGDKQFQQESK